MTKRLKVIDLFAGVGGFRLGLENAVDKDGENPFFKFVWANQWEPSTKTQHAADVYKDNFDVTAEEFVNEDINKVPTEKIPDHDLLTAGFPCQDYSVATTNKLSKGILGKKGVLWWQIERILREKEGAPDYLLLENVDRLLSSPASQRGRDFAIMLTSLNQLGYLVEWRVIDASEYGFPQRRKRVFFLGYKEDSDIYKEYNDNPKSWLVKDGILAQSFPVKKTDKELDTFDIPGRVRTMAKYKQNLHEVTDKFNKDKDKSPFNKAGLMIDGKIYTIDLEPNYKGKKRTLGDILLEESKVPDEYFIPEDQLDKWDYLKGAKKEKRTSKNGYEYTYSEGAITYPDDKNKPSRTVITGEGGQAPSRFKHVVETDSGKLRRLTPTELERLNMFPDDFTAGCSDGRRAFLMGNALVVGIVERIGKILYENL